MVKNWELMRKNYFLMLNVNNMDNLYKLLHNYILCE